MMNSRNLVVLALFLSPIVVADPPMGAPPAPLMSSEELAKSTTGWDGQPFSYPGGTPELTMRRLTLPQGHVLPMHCHPVPVIGYMVKGSLEVTKLSGEKAHYLERQGAIEVFREWHEGVALEDSELIVVYAGAEGLELTIAKEAHDPATSACQ